MKQNTQFIEEAIVLRTAPYRDSDLIVTLLARGLGKISAIARGARNSRRRFPGGIDLFDCGRFELKTPRGTTNLFSLENCNDRSQIAILRNNFFHLSLASFFVEITHLLTPEGDPHSGNLYELLRNTLTELETSNDYRYAWGTTIRYTLCFLQQSGFLNLKEIIDHIPPSLAESLQKLLEDPEEISRISDSEIVSTMHLLIRELELLHGRPLNTSKELKQIMLRTTAGAATTSM